MQQDVDDTRRTRGGSSMPYESNEQLSNSLRTDHVQGCLVGFISGIDLFPAHVNIAVTGGVCTNIGTATRQ